MQLVQRYGVAQVGQHPLVGIALVVGKVQDQQVGAVPCQQLGVQLGQRVVDVGGHVVGVGLHGGFKGNVHLGVGLFVGVHRQPRRGAVRQRPDGQRCVGVGGQRLVVVVEVKIPAAAVAEQHDHKIARRRAQQRVRVVAGNAHGRALAGDDLLRQGAARGQAVDAVLAGVVGRAVGVAGQRLAAGGVGHGVQHLGGRACGGVQGVQDDIPGVVVKIQVEEPVPHQFQGIQPVAQVLGQGGRCNAAVGQVYLHKIQRITVGNKVQLAVPEHDRAGVDAALDGVVLHGGPGAVGGLQDQPGVLAVVGDERQRAVRRGDDLRDHSLPQVEIGGFGGPVHAVGAGAAGVAVDAVLPHFAGVEQKGTIVQLRRVGEQMLAPEVNACLDPAAHLGIGCVRGG